MNSIYLIFGGNLGDRHQNILKARNFIQNELGRIIRYSSVYETEPWGFDHEQSFLNQVAEVQSLLSAEEMLKKIKNFEEISGKGKRETVYLPREIDVDILFFNREFINMPELTVPHPRLHERRFVLEPLNEIIPDFIHPVMKKSISQLLEECSDQKWVKKLN
ncbi:MAG: 2-amino-4-hydroxy-6-hydroxymethyldihydropteridine diphosphokinase [Bacteroidales bacterium]|nr:2-amino-4-hydroxy-6-hydroxymethyldihydropteridine diphosphokinase [Bacteroidales bacterium]